MAAGRSRFAQTDVNGDLAHDLIVLDSSGSSADATVLLGNAGSGGHGDGTFHTGTFIATGGATRSSIATGDLNGDGLTDAVVADPTNVTALLNITTSDNTPPTASVPAHAEHPNAGDTTYQFTVTYSDNQQIDAATINDGNVNVTGPGGFSQEATLVSQNLGNAATVSAVYQITFSTPLSSTDNGVYTVNANADGLGTTAVKDANGNARGGRAIGTFTLSVNPGQPQGAVQMATLVKKTHAQGRQEQDVLDRKVRLPQRQWRLLPAGHRQLAQRRNADGQQRNLEESGCRGRWVKGKTVKFTVVNASGTTDTKDTITMVLYASPTGGAGASTSTLHIAPAFVDLNNLWSGALPAVLPAVGKTATVPFSVQNIGNVTAKGTILATFTPLQNGVARRRSRSSSRFRSRPERPRS